MENQRLLITGGAGFIGSHLVDRLLPRAARIVVIDNFDPFYEAGIKRRNIAEHLKNPAYRLSENDIRDFGSLERLFSEERFDAIVHLAAKAGVRPSLADPRGYFETNVNGTLNLLELAARHGIRTVIFGSSSSIYGENPNPPFREDTVASPISPYAATKAAGELLAHTYSHLHGMRIVCLRFFTVYGARQRPDLAIHKFARLIDQERPIPVYGDGTSERDYTYIDDIIDGVVAALGYEASDFETINLGESQTVTLKRVIELLEEALGKRALVDRLPLQPGDVPRTHADISRARRLLGYNPTTSIEVGIPKFVEWFLQNR
jgi:UDP-glucuronate 4-epimerase